jgi:hypothetical protein
VVRSTPSTCVDVAHWWKSDRDLGAPGVAFVGSDRPSGVDTHPHADRAVGERPLRFSCGDHGISRAGEGDEERIALGVNLGAAVIGERLAQHLAMGARAPA